MASPFGDLLREEIARRMASKREEIARRMASRAGGGSSAPQNNLSTEMQQAQARQRALFAGQDYGMTVQDIQRNYPILHRGIASEAASRGAYESQGRGQAQADLLYQMQQASRKALMDYQRMIAEMRLQQSFADE